MLKVYKAYSDYRIKVKFPKLAFNVVHVLLLAYPPPQPYFYIHTLSFSRQNGFLILSSEYVQLILFLLSSSPSTLPTVPSFLWPPLQNLTVLQR